MQVTSKSYESSFSICIFKMCTGLWGGSIGYSVGTYKLFYISSAILKSRNRLFNSNIFSLSGHSRGCLPALQKSSSLGGSYCIKGLLKNDVIICLLTYTSQTTSISPFSVTIWVWLQHTELIIFKTRHIMADPSPHKIGNCVIIL